MKKIADVFVADVFTATTKGFGGDLLPPRYGYGKKYRYKINLQQYGVGFEIINWCLRNCKSKWGWYFIPAKSDGYLEDYENQHAILTFKSRQDAVYFKLTNG